MSPFRIGVLGCGMIAELGHLPALRNTPGLVLDAVYDVNWNRALAMQAKFPIAHAYPQESEFWESDLDAVVVCNQRRCTYKTCYKPRGMANMCFAKNRWR